MGTSRAAQLLFCILFNLPLAYSIQLQIPRFEPSNPNVLYQGAAEPSVGAVELIGNVDYLSDRIEEDSEIGLVEWVWNLYGKGKLEMVVDEKLHMEFDQRQVECLMIVGLWCAHPDQSLRPSIRQAIHVLNFEAALPNLPPKMPIPIYDVPTLSVSSGEPLLTTSLEVGR
ncbi:hypothetical protein FEM48_Zijuj08G0139900 [Ziziphus jujuba var. spinosa]|uniref:L-type lectin-domain containing receptor kinase IX.1-like n=1 Tax=Ziziphus jujuba var. spinosa TaxID=714518 RepID=A0A978UZI4_ZIZJJ|nr:hypothetical protein FEM48_Zijuj08G0139900 [Ziziphus jujuba var. spinosa]